MRIGTVEVSVTSWGLVTFPRDILKLSPLSVKLLLLKVKLMVGIEEGNTPCR